MPRLVLTCDQEKLLFSVGIDELLLIDYSVLAPNAKPHISNNALKFLIGIIRKHSLLGLHPRFLRDEAYPFLNELNKQDFVIITSDWIYINCLKINMKTIPHLDDSSLTATMENEEGEMQVEKQVMDDCKNEMTEDSTSQCIKVLNESTINPYIDASATSAISSLAASSESANNVADSKTPTLVFSFEEDTQTYINPSANPTNYTLDDLPNFFQHSSSSHLQTNTASPTVADPAEHFNFGDYKL